jgi:hypothetical protein
MGAGENEWNLFAINCRLISTGDALTKYGKINSR